MTLTIDGAGPAAAPDVPREVDPGLPTSDKNFRRIATAVGASVLVLTGSIGAFLGYQSIPTFKHYGLSFLTENEWVPSIDKIGISAVLLGTVQVAVVALIVSFPLALLTALFISQYAPARIKSTLVSLIDLMAAVPSIIYGLWALFLLKDQVTPVSRWLHQNLGWIPIFDVHNADPNAAVWAQSRYTGSVLIAGLAVSMMTIPLACAVMRGVFDETPLGEREAALALGSTRWGMIRTVVIPFGKGGIIGGTMLALGRALGETAAVLLVINAAFDIKINILETGTQTTSSLIAGNFGEATTSQLAALLTAGFVLFVITILVNTVAAIFIGRSRSGASTDL